MFENALKDRALPASKVCVRTLTDDNGLNGRVLAQEFRSDCAARITFSTEVYNLLLFALRLRTDAAA